MICTIFVQAMHLRNWDETFSSELRGLMDEFMGDLDPLEKQILLCRFAEGMGQEETAQNLKSTRMKVRTIEAKLRKRLRGYLQGSGYIEHLAGAKK